MGTKTITRKISTGLAQLNHPPDFFETGALQGDTTKWADGRFERAHTIERAHNLYDGHIAELEKPPGVTPHCGDSREQLMATPG